MSSALNLTFKNACIEGSWDGWKAISGINYAVAGGNYHVVYSATLSLDESRKLTGFTVSTNFVGNGSTGARSVTCFLYTFDPSTSTSGPPTGFVTSVTLDNKYFNSNGEYVSFTFSNLNIENSGTIYLWFNNNMSANPGNDQIYHYATGNGITQTPAISNASFAVADLTTLTLASSEVTTGGRQVVTIGNGSGRAVTVSVYYGSTLITRGTTTTGTRTIAVAKNWFTAAGLTSVQSFSVSVQASAEGTSTLYADFTVKAGSDMKPTVGTPTVSLVQTGAAATNFPNTYIAGYSKAKVEATAAAGSNAAITRVTVSYPGGSVQMSYNGSTGKYEATTPVLNQSGAFTVTAEDQRELTGSKSSSAVTVTPYTPPSVVIDEAFTWRCSASGTQERGGSYWRAKAEATWYSALSGNSLLQFKAEIQGVGSPVSLTSGVQTAAQGGTLNRTDIYTLVFTIQDKVSEAVTKSFRLESAQRFFVMTETSFGFGKAPTHTHSFEISEDHTVYAAAQIHTSFLDAVATGSREADADNISDLVDELRYSSGCMGSCTLTTGWAHQGGGADIAAGMYNYLWIPHRSGGLNGEAVSDNCNYGTLLLFGMSATSMFVLRYAGGSIADAKKVY
jgi:hypothetical protein